MANKRTELQPQDTQKREVQSGNGTERTRARRAYIPYTDIFETNDEIVIVADMPGVDADSLDINLEKNVLTINGYVESAGPDNCNLAYAEYEVGDYQRRFTLSEEIDQEEIEATIKNGVLRLRLPKADSAKTKKITVKAA